MYVRPMIVEDKSRLPPEYIGVNPKCCSLQYCLYKLHRFLRFFYVSFWYYFSPFFFTSFQFILPLYVIYRDGKLPDVVLVEKN